MFLNLGQRTQAQVWLDVQFSDFRMLAGMGHASLSPFFREWPPPGYDEPTVRLSSASF